MKLRYYVIFVCRHLQEMKMKKKKPKTEENLEFRGREEIKFGDVVKAPPKLVAIPKVELWIPTINTHQFKIKFMFSYLMKGLKTSQDASKQRLRLQAVEDYRKRKGWVSRPGIHLPPPVTTSPLV